MQNFRKRLNSCELLEEHREDWPNRLKYIQRTPDNLSGFANHALSIVRYGSVVEPDSDEIPKMLTMAAQATAALFIVDQAGGKPVEVRLGDQTIVYKQRVDESLLSAGKWLQAFYLSLICRENDWLDALCQTRVEQLRKSSTTSPEYVYLLVHALQGWWTEADDTSARFVAALRATDPEADPQIAKDWTLYIDVPLIDVAFRCVTDDARFDDALHKAVGLHKEYYSANEDRRDEKAGFISFPLTAMAALARDRELNFAVESGYLPAQLVNGKAFVDNGKR